MAITRAQQVRQMLEDGGMLVSPSKDGKRPGYRRSNYDTSGGGLRSNTAEKGSMGPSQAGGAGVGRDRDFQQRGASKTDYAKTSQKYKDEGTQQVYDGSKNTSSRDPFIPTTPPEEPTFIGYDDANLYKTGKKKFTVPSIFNREFMFNLAQKLPRFGAPTIKERQNAYKEYLQSMGVSYPETLDSDNPFDFFESDAFDKKSFNIKDPITDEVINVQNYGDFALENFGTPGIKFSGDVGNKEVFVKGYRADGSKIYDVREKRDNDGPPILGRQYREPGDDNDGDGDGDNEDDTNTGGLGFRFMSRGGSPMDAPTEGGIMDLESGRQMYFLGKLVKKATRAVKKIAKSPLGKAAILGGAAYFAGQGGGLGALLKKAAVGAPTDLVTGKRAFSGLFGTGGEFNLKAGLLGQNPFLTFGGLAAILPFLSEEEQEQLISSRGKGLNIGEIRNNPYTFASQVGSGSGTATAFLAEGGKPEPVAKKTMPLLDMGGKEMDLRDDGGFVPIGRMEKADDVPARLSKNEFVFTADAVRNAGEGDVDKGAEVMYNMMKNLESGGQVSEESQGLEGAREMFQTSKRLEEVL